MYKPRAVLAQKTVSVILHALTCSLLNHMKEIKMPCSHPGVETASALHFPRNYYRYIPKVASCLVYLPGQVLVKASNFSYFQSRRSRIVQ